MNATRQALGSQRSGFDHKQVIVIAIDAKTNTAVCRDRYGNTLNARTDLLRAKGAAPEVGEQWIMDRTYDGWTFALCVTTSKDSSDPSGGAAFKRTTATYTSSTLAAGDSETGTIVLGFGYRLLRIAMSAPGRVRLYSTVIGQMADIDRMTSTTPSLGSDLVLDISPTSDLLAFNLSPIIEGASMEATPALAVPITVTATDPGVVSTTLTFVRTE